MRRLLGVLAVALLLLPPTAQSYTVCGVGAVPTSRSQTGDLGVVGSLNSGYTKLQADTGYLGAVASFASTMQTGSPGSESIVGNIGALAAPISAMTFGTATTGSIGAVAAPSSAQIQTATQTGSIGVLASLAATMTPTEGGGSSLIDNPGFESAIGGANNWTASASASGVAQRTASAVMTGSYVGELHPEAAFDDEEGVYVGDSFAALSTTIPKARLDSTPTMTWDVRWYAVTYFTFLDIIAYDNTDTAVSSTVNDVQRVALAGTNVGGSGIHTSIKITPSMNTTYSFSYNVKTHITDHLLAGKTWADVSYVNVSVVGYTVSWGGVYIDNFN